jgi:murein DD-endopeptidase MepM/ murein hydrolase activator NlpD
MANKFFSLIIVPHHKGNTKKITFSRKKVKILVGILTVLFIALVCFFIDYFAMSDTREKYKALYEENLNQKTTIAQYKVTVNRLKTNVENFENYARKLNLMAGLEPGNVPGAVGVDNKGRNRSQTMGLAKAEIVNQRANGIGDNLNKLMRFFEDKRIRLVFTPSISPTNGWRTSGYGSRADPFTGKWTPHYGIDIAAAYGSPLWATADGTVIKAEMEKIGGNTVIINHRCGYTSVYCHLSKFNVKVGQKVKREDVIGFVGQTGRAFGTHVHYEVRLNGKALDPIDFILDEFILN